MLVGGVVVDGQMEFLPSRSLAIDFVEESDEFLMPVACHTLPDDTALQHVEALRSALADHAVCASRPLRVNR